MGVAVEGFRFGDVQSLGPSSEGERLAICKVEGFKVVGVQRFMF